MATEQKVDIITELTKLDIAKIRLAFDRKVITEAQYYFKIIDALEHSVKSIKATILGG